MKVTQEQLDQYITKNLQPLADELTEYARGKNIPASDFYLACISITKYILNTTGGRKAELLVEALNDIGGEWIAQELRQRMESEK